MFVFTFCGIHILFSLRFVYSADSKYFETYLIEQSQYGRNAVRKEQYKWPNRTVPYIFSDEYSSEQQTIIVDAMNIFMDETCVKFIPKTNDHIEHIQFVKSGGCGSNIGCRRGQHAPLNVSFTDQCLTITGAIQHEMLHVLGLLHEQCRSDRDDYVTILWDNIERSKIIIMLIRF